MSPFSKPAILPLTHPLNLKNKDYTTSVMPEPGGPGGPLTLQYLADQLTLFQPGQGRLYPQISSPSGITVPIT